MVRTKRSAIALAFGARTGVLMISMSSLANTASESRVNLLSRSRIRNRNGDGRSWSIQTNWRACCVTPWGSVTQSALCGWVGSKLAQSIPRAQDRIETDWRVVDVDPVDLISARAHEPDKW